MNALKEGIRVLGPRHRALSLLQTMCHSIIPSKNTFASVGPLGRERPHPGAWPISSRATIRIGGSCSTAGFCGMVAHWRGLDRQHGNSTSPSAGRGAGVSGSPPIAALFLPPELRFGYTDSHRL